MIHSHDGPSPINWEIIGRRIKTRKMKISEVSGWTENSMPPKRKRREK